MLEMPEIAVLEGDAAQVTIPWHDFDVVPETPTAVRYQVFDHYTKVAVSDIVDVPTPASTTVFIVPGSDLPASATSFARRRLILQVEAEFSGATDIKTTQGYVVVLKRLEFS
ncbi:MAG: hypothetical protein IPM07_25575 [Anaerolineales bacterium]|nr:hypothetical protein [Anaerolineales bacterium]